VETRHANECQHGKHGCDEFEIAEDFHGTAVSRQLSAISLRF
jgi:hypothetical protein